MTKGELADQADSIAVEHHAYTSSVLGHVLTAMVTPFQGDGSVDYDAFQALARYLVDNGSDRVVVAGATGESPTPTDRERLDPIRAPPEGVGGPAPGGAGARPHSTDPTGPP